MSDFSQSVYEYLRTIPKGKVVTYGQVARAIGCPYGALAVGNALHANPDPDYYPCYKVVNSNGKLAEHFRLGIEEQRKRLEKDGIIVEGDKVNLKVFQYE